VTDTVKKVSALTAAGHGEASRRSRRYEGGLWVVTFRFQYNGVVIGLRISTANLPRPY